MQHGVFSRLITNRLLVYARIKQLLIASVILGLAWLVIDWDTWELQARVVITGCILLSGLAGLIWGEIERVRRTHGFRLFPPGTGTLGSRQAKANERLASMWELWTWRWKKPAWKGAIRYGRVLPEHRFFGFPPNLRVAGPPGDPRHVITIAGARSGKGRAMLVPNLLLYEGSTIVVDPKGQLAAITAHVRGNGSARVRKFLGQDIFIVDPENIVTSHPVKASFNPLSIIDEHDRESVRYAKIIAETLVPPTSSSDANAEFFVKQARALLEAAILHVATFEPEASRHLPQVRKLLMQGSDFDLHIIEDEFALAGLPAPVDNPIDAFIYMMSRNPAFGGEIQGVANRLLAAQSSQRTDILGEVGNAISFIGTPGIQEFLDGSAGPMFSFQQLRDKATTIYICMSNTALQRQERNLLRMLVELAAVTLERTPKRKDDWPVLILMDEFYSLGYLKSIDVGIGAFAGYGILLWPVVQSVTQLKEHYPKTWENLLANCRAQQYFGQLDPETHKHLSDRLAGLYSPVELASNIFAMEDRRQVVTFADRPTSMLELTYYDEIFPSSHYDVDPYL
ncbi:MAG: hypothetical protein E8D42_11750 [Nitrospira sp.]|nr:MAG: hypothetical protein E8D42_11750 [Nitrospira sp.]